MDQRTTLIAAWIVIGVLFLANVGFLIVSHMNIQDLQEHVEVLDQNVKSELNNTRASLEESLKQERIQNAQQYGILENRTFENFRALENAINQKTSQLKLNLESQLNSVASEIGSVRETTEADFRSISKQVGRLKEQSSDLESRIDETHVESSDFSAIVDEVIKAVVSVQTDGGQGSGVIYDPRGYVMTNKHVIEDAAAIQVVDSQGRSYGVTLIGTATNADLAVLKIIANHEFDFLDWGGEANVGTRVIAVGSPLGLTFSVTEGIISASNRVIDSSGLGYLQTDVPINPGNSGGSLVNSAKKIVGINTLKAEGEGIGFAIPASIAESIGQQAVSAIEGT